MVQVFGGDKAKARKVASLHQDVRALQTAQVAAEAEYGRVLGRNREVRRWGPSCSRFHG